MRLQVAPVGRDLGLIFRDVKSILQSIRRQVDRVEDGIETVHDMALRAKEFQIDVQRRIEEPKLQLAAVLQWCLNEVLRFLQAFSAAESHKK